MAKVDELAVSKYSLSVPQMMENAGRNVARWIADELKPKKVIVLFGKGNNGGDGLCCARHLAIYGIDIEIVSAFESGGNENVMHQLKILKEMGIIPVKDFKAEEDDPENQRFSVHSTSKNSPSLAKREEVECVIVDALLGYNIKGNPEGRFAELIKASNFMRKSGMKVVSYDLPSGMDPDTGEARDPCVEADYTMTLALPKEGLKKSGEKFGKLFLVNIGIPNELYEKELGIKIDNYFKEGDVVEIR